MIQQEPIIRRSAMSSCALCDNAPCDTACTHALHPSRLLRSIWFANEQTAALSLPEQNPCLMCSAPCEHSCLREGDVPIRDLINRLVYQVRPVAETPVPQDTSRLASDICGIPLENPFLLSSSVVSSSYDMCARAFEMGWAGAAYKTICTLDIHEASPRYSAITGDNGTIIGFKNIEQLSDHSVTKNMEIFRRLKKNYPSKFLLASIMGQSADEWRDLARMCQDNGADAVELNFSCPNMVENGLGSDIGEIPEQVERFTEAAVSGCSIPVLAKLTPNVSSMIPSALAARRGGARGISAINTIKSVMDLNIHTFVSSPPVHGESAVGGYSGNAVRPIALRFVSEIMGDPRLADLHMSAMGGIETWMDALDFILLGARSVQVTTAVMQYGYRVIDDLISGLNLYMAEKGFARIQDMTGLGLDSLRSKSTHLERDTVLFPKFLHEKCIGCGRCRLSCRDGGHQAICMDESGRPKLDGSRCVGCHLCLLVCPANAIVPSGKRVTPRR